MPYNILDFAFPDADRQKEFDKLDKADYRSCYKVDPGKVYPATLKRMQEVANGCKNPGEELLDGIASADAAKRLVSAACKLKKEDFALANIPYSKCDENTDFDRREEVIELARRWFTRALKVSCKTPLYIHITRDYDWKL